MAFRSGWRTAALLGGIAVAVRVFYLALDGGNVALTGDAVSYDAYARHFISGWEWVTTPLADREPLYPALMAFSYAFPGSDIGALQWLQVLLGAATVVVVYLWLRSLARESVAATAALLVALNPHFIFYAAYPFRENLTIPLVTGTLALYIQASRTTQMRPLILATGLFALLIHTDVRFLPLSACIPFVLASMNRSLRSTLVQTTWMWLLLIVLMIPYEVRCYVALGKPVIVTERFLEVWLPIVEERFEGTTPTKAEDRRVDWLRVFEAEKTAGLEELTREEREYLLAGGRPSLKRLHSHWFMFKEYWRFARLTEEYRPYPDGRFEKPWATRHNVASSLVMVPFLFFVPFVWRRSRSSEQRVALALLMFLFAHMLMHVAVHSIERYRVPMEVTTSILTAMGMASVWTLVKEKWSRSPSPPD